MEGVAELGELQLCRGSGRGQRLENDVPLARVGVTDYDVLEAAWGPHVVAGPSTLSKSSGTEYQAQPEVRSAVMAEAADALPSHGDALGGEGAGDEEEDARSAQEGARASGGGWRIDVGDQEGQATGVAARESSAAIFLRGHEYLLTEDDEARLRRSMYE
jgi:hypothetical protein